MFFYIKFSRQGFENDYWHRKACRAIQQAFSKPGLVNLISKYYFISSQADSLFKLAIVT